MGEASDSWLLELGEALRQREAELATRIARVQADRRRTSQPLDPDFEDQAVQRENDEVLDGLDHVERQELAATRIAIRRIDAGCFGICDACGRDVDPLRLEADPSVATCLACAEKASGGASQGG